MTKIVLVGDGACGKSCFAVRFDNPGTHEVTGDTWNDTTHYYDSTGDILHIHRFELEHPTGPHSVDLWTLVGQEAVSQLRSMAYPGTDIFIIGYNCFDGILDNIPSVWIGEITEFDQSPWFIVVGMQSDRKTENPQRAISANDAEAAARQWGACSFVETSAKTGEGFAELRKIVSKLAIKKRRGDMRPPFELPIRFDVEKVEKQLTALKGQCKSETLIGVRICTDCGVVFIQFPEDTMLLVVLGEALLQTGLGLSFDESTLSLAGEQLKIDCSLLDNGICDGGTLTVVTCGCGQLEVLDKLSAELNKAAAEKLPPALEADLNKVKAELAADSSARTTSSAPQPAARSPAPAVPRQTSKPQPAVQSTRTAKDRREDDHGKSCAIS